LADIILFCPLPRKGVDTGEPSEMVKLIENVIESEGPNAVHGLFCRGGHAPFFVEVLNRNEERLLKA